MLTPAQVAQKWVNNTSAAGQAFTDGVNNVTVAPGEKAAQNLQGYINGVNNAAQRWAANTRAVSLQDWKASMLGKGKARIGQGVAAAQQKFSDFMSNWLPYEAAMQQRIASMPKGTLADSQARAAASIAYNAAYSKRLPGSG